MSTYHYKALAADGKTRLGTLVADDDRVASRELRRQGLTPVFIGTSRPGGLSLKLPQFGKRRSHDILHFTQEVATLVNAGVPLERALSITSELTERPQFQSVIADLLKALRGGKSFAESLAAQEGVFSELYVSMVRAGEVSGSLPLVMDRLADFERSRDELRGYIISSLTYPALLSLVGAGSVFVLLRFVIPRFAEAFTASNITMPLPMQMLLAASDIVRTFGPIFLGSADRRGHHLAVVRSLARGASGLGPLSAARPAAGDGFAEGGYGPLCARHGDARRQWCSAGAVDRHHQRDPHQSLLVAGA